MMEVKYGTYIRNNDNFNFDFYVDLSMENKLFFVNSVVDLLVGDNYNYIIKDLVFDFYIIDVFTNVDLTEIKESNNFISDVEKLLNETNIVDIVKANAKFGLIEELNEAIDKSIEYKTGIHKNSFDELGKALTGLVNAIEDKINKVNVGDLSEVAKALGNMNGDITPESIVKAYIETDVFKNNAKEVKKTRKRKTKASKDVIESIEENKDKENNLN